MLPERVGRRPALDKYDLVRIGHALVQVRENTAFLPARFGDHVAGGIEAAGELLRADA